jgi:hypothetical protein
METFRRSLLPPYSNRMIINSHCKYLRVQYSSTGWQYRQGSFVVTLPWRCIQWGSPKCWLHSLYVHSAITLLLIPDENLVLSTWPSKFSWYVRPKRLPKHAKLNVVQKKQTTFIILENYVIVSVNILFIWYSSRVLLDVSVIIIFKITYWIWNWSVIL